jgi:hypothetical protein
MSMLTEWLQADEDERRAITEAHNFGLSLNEYRNLGTMLWFLYTDIQITVLHGADGKAYVSLGRSVKEWKRA